MPPAPPIGLLATAGGEGWRQAGELGLALGLSAIMGIERELREKSAGLRTHTLVGLGAALFMLISKYGFADVLVSGKVVVDPSRVAAQIASGIGFVGAGVIFVRRGSVKGLTTAATIWVTAAVGAAAGAGLWILASTTVGAYLVVAGPLSLVSHRVSPRHSVAGVVRVRHVAGGDALARCLATASARGFTVDELATATLGPGEGGGREGAPLAESVLHCSGHGPLGELSVALAGLEGVTGVHAGDLEPADVEDGIEGQRAPRW